MLFQIKLDNIGVRVSFGVSIIQVCLELGYEIPRFCYHNYLSIAGNCRMCLVELGGSDKLVVSCGMPVAENQRIFTNSLRVRKGRENVMELLLLNHPLDCPVCDQGGECDLQDQSLIFGSDRGRFYEYKRAVEDKNISSFIKTVMTRCIHCTRCVRFLSEVGGNVTLGVSGRGNTMEIGTYIQNNISTELSGNIIDLCPVGALTLKPNAFMARSWELKNTEVIDFVDGFGSNMLLSSRGLDIVRVLPLKNWNLNELWLTDKARFCYDGLRYQRLMHPILKFKHGYIQIGWEFAFKILLRKMYSRFYKFNLVVSKFTDIEFLSVIKRFGASLNVVPSSLHDYVKSDTDFTREFVFNIDVTQIREAGIVLILGANLRMELPLVLLRLRRESLRRSIAVCVFGTIYEYKMSVRKLGNTVSSILKFFEGSHVFGTLFIKTLNQLMFVGSYTVGFNFNHIVGKAKIWFTIFELFLSKTWNGICYTFINGLEVGLRMFGISSSRTSSVISTNFNFLYYVDEFEYNSLICKNNFSVYLGMHGDLGAQYSNLVLPVTGPMEKRSYLMNVEGVVQKSRVALNMSSESKLRKDSYVIYGLYQFMVGSFTFPIEYSSFLLEDMLFKLTIKLCSAQRYKGYFPLTNNYSYFLGRLICSLGHLEVVSYSYYNDLTLVRFSKVSTLYKSNIPVRCYNFIGL